MYEKYQINSIVFISIYLAFVLGNLPEFKITRHQIQYIVYLISTKNFSHF